jgi:hypothetical protein
LPDRDAQAVRCEGSPEDLQVAAFSRGGDGNDGHELHDLHDPNSREPSGEAG